MGEEDKPRKKKEYEVSVVGENTSFKVKVLLDDQQFKKFISFVMRK